MDMSMKCGHKHLAKLENIFYNRTTAKTGGIAMQKVGKILAVVTALLAVLAAAYAVWKNWEKIKDFLALHCPCHSSARNAEFADYVD